MTMQRKSGSLEPVQKLDEAAVAASMPKEQETFKRAARPYFFRYLSHKGIQNIPSYKYHGSDASYLYQKVVSPALNHAIENNYIPRWLHPNVITLTGLMFMVVSHCITWYYIPTFTEEAPAWVFAFNAFAMVAYWVLDALDGKQARKLGVSSPLGLLVDHGCDALNTTIGMLNVAAMLNLGPTMQAFYLWVAPTGVFFAATWEEYYVGSLNLPVINGPNEGVLLGALFHLWTAYAGTRWWTDMTSLGVQRSTILNLVLATLGLITIVTNVFNVSQAVAEMKNGEGKFTEGQFAAASRKIAVSRGIPFVIMVVFAGLWAQYSPSDVLGRNPRAFLWVLGLAMCKQVMTMMVAHLSDDEYHPFGRTIAGATALGIHMLLTYIYVGFDAASEDLFLLELGAVVFVSYVHMVFSLACEMSRLLDIPVLTVPIEKQKAA
eukprot:TRINITY_DN10322_c0_g2_i2.p1 TRINITY_DN10322_c0_g2~~TRINITY_DN10322_c0_g2_i2.p1  ORF type:complete len:434 (+),score=157.83 TRINITY_DN10322_c0_g2_i2:135-1436(+)